MFEFEWKTFVTGELLASINSFAEIDGGSVDFRKVLEKILTNVGGLPYTKTRYNSAEKTCMAQSLLHEAIKHTLRSLSNLPRNPGFYLANSAAGIFEKEIKFIEKIGLNSATADEFKTLPNINMKLANAIIEERNLRGRFKSLEDLKVRVKGIGQKTIDKIEYAIRIDSPDEKISEKIRIDGDFQKDFQKLISIQNGETSREHVKAALDMVCTVCASNPHPATSYSLIRDFSATSLELQTQPEWIAILWGSDYYKKLPELLTTSKKSILVCMFHIALPDVSHPTYKILEALITAHQKGVSIKVLLDNDKSTDPYRSTKINTPAKDFLEKNGISCRFDSEDALLHSKFVVIDDKLLILGSHNWTAGSYFQFDDLSFALKSEALAKEVVVRFDELWNNANP